MKTPPDPGRHRTPAGTTYGSPSTPTGREAELTALQALGAALAERGCQADLVTPQPYLSVRPADAETAHQIHMHGPQFCWPVTLPVGHQAEIGLAADTIVWAMRAQPSQASR